MLRGEYSPVALRSSWDWYCGRRSDPATPCTPCVPGFAAGEAHAGACVDCQAGQYAGSTAAECTNCTAGSSDGDSDAATPCTECAAGFAAAEGHSGPCDACLDGQYTDTSAAECVDCVAGKSDHDSQPNTPCATFVGLCRAWNVWLV